MCTWKSVCVSTEIATMKTGVYVSEYSVQFVRSFIWKKERVLTYTFIFTIYNDICLQVKSDRLTGWLVGFLLVRPSIHPPAFLSVCPLALKETEIQEGFCVCFNMCWVQDSVLCFSDSKKWTCCHLCVYIYRDYFNNLNFKH